jgi:hypothetical protein
MADMNRDLADALDTLRAIARGPQRRTRDAHDVALALQRARGMSAAKKGAACAVADATTPAQRRALLEDTDALGAYVRTGDLSHLTGTRAAALKAIHRAARKEPGGQRLDARRVAALVLGDALDLDNLELLHREQLPRLVFTFAAEEDDGRPVVVRAETTLDTCVLRATIAPWRKDRGSWQEAT